MKNILTIITVSLLFLSAKAQDWSGKVYQIGKIYPGYYVTNSLDTVKGYISMGGQAYAQKHCNYYKNETDKKPVKDFKPEDISSYMVGDKLYRSIHFSGGLLAKPLRFNLVTKDGALVTYVFYNENNEYEKDGQLKSDMVFHKPHDAANSQPVMLQDFGLKFAKKMSDYLADDAELAKKVLAKEKGYGMLNILEIIDEYNTWYASQKN